MLPLVIYLFICHVNIVSLSKNIGKLDEFLDKFTRKIDIICISETRLTDAKLKSATILGYQMYSTAVRLNQWQEVGGAAIYVANSLITQQLNFKINYEDCKDVWEEITLQNNRKLITGSLYRHPHYNILNFEVYLSSIIQSLKSYDDFILLRDLNVDWNKHNSSQKIKLFFDHLNSLECQQIICKPTNVISNSETILDHIYKSIASRYKVLRQLSPCCSNYVFKL